MCPRSEGTGCNPVYVGANPTTDSFTENGGKCPGAARLLCKQTGREQLPLSPSFFGGGGVCPERLGSQPAAGRVGYVGPKARPTKALSFRHKLLACRSTAEHPVDKPDDRGASPRELTRCLSLIRPCSIAATELPNLSVVGASPTPDASFLKERLVKQVLTLG